MADIITPDNFATISAMANASPATQSLLYDLGLLPEQTMHDSAGWHRTSLVVLGMDLQKRTSAAKATHAGATRLWLDCEFNEYEGRHDLISMALVTEDGREWYEVLPCQNPREWVAANVIPRLDKEPLHDRIALGASLRVFLGQFQAIHVIADWPSDIALFCDALLTGPGERIDTPPLTLELIRLDGTSTMPHNALADARGVREVHLAALKAQA